MIRQSTAKWSNDDAHCARETMAMTNETFPGHEYLAFLGDPGYWTQGGPDSQTNVYAEDVVLLVDGRRVEQDELTPDSIASESQVVIVAGDVFQFMTPLHSLQEHFDSWREAAVDQSAPHG
jgi:hypothetical protein